MRNLLFIVAGLAAAFYFTDIESESIFKSVVLPMVDLVLICAFALWIAGRTGWQHIDRSGTGGFFDDFFGGDGGGGCD